MKSTRVVVRANGGSWQVSSDHQHYIHIAGSQTYECVGSGDIDIVGEFYDEGNIILQFLANNPWIGSPWVAVGEYLGDIGGWKNGRTALSEGEDHIFVQTIYTDDSEYDVKTRVIRLADTDTKNFEIWPGWYE